MSDSANDLNNNHNNNNHKQVLDSLDPTCNELKHAYDACFDGWFTSSFLKGEHKGQTTPCDELLQCYTACVKASLHAKKIELDDLSKIYETEGTRKKQEEGSSSSVQ